MSNSHQVKAVLAMRIEKETRALKAKHPDYIESYERLPGEKELWRFRIRPKDPPYDGSILNLLIDCTGDYPYKAPILRFTQPMYHPNVEKTGEVCIPIVAYDNWKPTTTFNSLILSVLQILKEPDLARPIRFDIAEECIHNPTLYLSKVTDLTKNYK